MAGRSSVTRLPPEIKEAIDLAIREDRATIDEIVAAIRALGADVSRSAVGRYAKSARERMETYRQAREIAAVWAKRMEEQPNGDVAQLNLQLMSTLAFKVLSEIGEGGAEGEVTAAAGPMDIMLLAKGLEHLAKAERHNLDRELKLRKEIAQQAAERAVASAKRAGLSAEAAAEIRRDILGIAA